MILVPLFDFKFLRELAATAVGTRVPLGHDTREHDRGSRSDRWAGPLALLANVVRSVQGKEQACGIQFVVAHTRTPERVQEFCRAKDLALRQSYYQILSDENIDAVARN